MEDNLSWWQRLLALEPARFIGVVVAVVPLLAGLGLTLSDHAVAALVAFLGAFLPLLQAAVTRAHVYAPATVARTAASEHAAGYDAGVEAAAGSAGELEETADVPAPAVAQGQPGLGVPDMAADASGP